MRKNDWHFLGAHGVLVLVCRSESGMRGGEQGGYKSWKREGDFPAFTWM
jgi:hypothetical protein